MKGKLAHVGDQIRTDDQPENCNWVRMKPGVCGIISLFFCPFYLAPLQLGSSGLTTKPFANPPPQRLQVERKTMEIRLEFDDLRVLRSGPRSGGLMSQGRVQVAL